MIGNLITEVDHIYNLIIKSSKNLIMQNLNFVQQVMVLEKQFGPIKNILKNLI